MTVRNARARALAWGGLLVLATAWAADAAATTERLPSLAAKTAGMRRLDGLLRLYLDEAQGRVWLALPPPLGTRRSCGSYIYYDALATGLGSNPVGLDRGQLGESRLVEFRRFGRRVVLEEPNQRFRAHTADSLEARAVRESFATSILWAKDAAALDADGTALIDFTDFLLRDAHEVVATLERTGQGSFSLDRERSLVDLERCLAFPDNLAFETVLTFAGQKPGEHVRETAPSPGSVTLGVHHALVRLPDDGYRPRAYDPRSGSFAVRFADYAAPLDRPLDQRWLVRHRLEKTDPRAASSPVKKPIVYYLDPGTPEPVRSALLDGARWWAEAFERAGFQDAFRVELLPPGAHPLDVRYHVIQWVHRSTRGWSYGGGIVDPRTGELLKGHVTLGSLRVRHDRLLFEGLAGTARTGSGAPDDPVQLSLARLRQLSAHEVGHTLGLAHNFAASTYGGRASVMDYPAPLIEIAADGSLDFSRAYGVGIGEWDAHAIRYAYAEFPPGVDEEAALEDILADGIRRGLLYASDDDARPDGAADPRANLWDNGDDPAAGLRQALAVRRLALDRFGRDRVRRGTPLALLQEVLAPVYFHHRYQLDAAVKVLGGVEYQNAVRGDGQNGARVVEGARQRAARAAVLEVLRPETLDLPDSVIALLLPRPAGYEPHRELFASRTAPTFDALGAAATAAEMAVTALVQRERAARLVDQHRRDPSLPSLEETLEALVEQVWPRRSPSRPRLAELQRVLQTAVVHGFLALAADEAAAPAVRARVEDGLRRLNARLRRSGDGTERAHARHLAGEIERFLERRRDASTPPAVADPPPPGSPIGLAGLDDCSWGSPAR